jgi:hypothetical protein
MEQYEILKTENGYHIKGLPDAIKVVKIDTREARAVADMSLHRSDLRFSLECLNAINSTPDEPYILRQALWHSAIVHYSKCFQGSCARISLSENKIYKNDTEGLEIFNWFKNLRNKHIVHDENSYAQSLPSAAINDGSKSFKIEKILCLTQFIVTLEQATYNNLHLLVTKALQYVENKFDELCNILTVELEKESYEDLIKRDVLSVRIPTLEEISIKRIS